MTKFPISRKKGLRGWLTALFVGRKYKVVVDVGIGEAVSFASTLEDARVIADVLMREIPNASAEAFIRGRSGNLVERVRIGA